MATLATWLSVPIEEDDGSNNRNYIQLVNCIKNAYDNDESIQQQPESTVRIPWSEIQVFFLESDEYQLVVNKTMPALWAAYVLSGASSVLLAHVTLSAILVLGLIFPRQIEDHLLSVSQQADITEQVIAVQNELLSDKFIWKSFREPKLSDGVKKFVSWQDSYGIFSNGENRSTAAAITSESTLMNCLRHVRAIGNTISRIRKIRRGIDKMQGTDSTASTIEEIAVEEVKSSGVPLDKATQRFLMQLQSMIIAYRASLVDLAAKNIHDEQQQDSLTSANSSGVQEPEEDERSASSHKSKTSNASSSKQQKPFNASTKRVISCRELECLLELTRAFAAVGRVRLECLFPGQSYLRDFVSFITGSNSDSDVTSSDLRDKLLGWAMQETNNDGSTSMFYDYSNVSVFGVRMFHRIIPFCEQTFPTSNDITLKRLPTPLCVAKTEQEARNMLEQMIPAFARLYGEPREEEYDIDQLHYNLLDQSSVLDPRYPVRLHVYINFESMPFREQEQQLSALSELATTAMRQLFDDSVQGSIDLQPNSDIDMPVKPRRLFLVAPAWAMDSKDCMDTRNGQCAVSIVHELHGNRSTRLVAFPEFVLPNYMSARLARAVFCRELVKVPTKGGWKIVPFLDNKFYDPYSKTCIIPATSVHPSVNEIAARAVHVGNIIRATAPGGETEAEAEVVKRFCITRANLRRTHTHSKHTALPIPTEFVSVPRADIDHSMLKNGVLSKELWANIEASWPCASTDTEAAWRQYLMKHLLGHQCTWTEGNPSMQEPGSTRCPTCSAVGKTRDSALITYLDLPAWAHATTLRYAGQLKNLILQRALKIRDGKPFKSREDIEHAFCSYANSIGIGNMWRGVLNTLRHAVGTGSPVAPFDKAALRRAREQSHAQLGQYQSVVIKIDKDPQHNITDAEAFALYRRAFVDTITADIHTYRDFVDLVRGDIGDFRPEKCDSRDLLVYGRKGGSLRFGAGGIFYEFSEDIGGGLFDFIQYAKCVDYIEAFDWVCEYTKSQGIHDELIQKARDIYLSAAWDKNREHYAELRKEKALANADDSSPSKEPMAKKLKKPTTANNNNNNKKKPSTTQLLSTSNVPMLPSMDLLMSYDESSGSASNSSWSTSTTATAISTSSVSILTPENTQDAIVPQEHSLTTAAQAVKFINPAAAQMDTRKAAALGRLMAEMTLPIEQRAANLKAKVAESPTAAYAKEIWSESVPIVVGSLADRYLRNTRMLDAAATNMNPLCARFHRPKVWSLSKNIGAFAAVVFAIYNPYLPIGKSGEIIGVHCVLVDERGKKAMTPEPKITYGVRDACVLVHMPVKNDGDEKPIVILGEGPETTLSICELFPNSYGFCSAGLSCIARFDNQQALQDCDYRICLLGDNDANQKLQDVTKSNYLALQNRISTVAANNAINSSNSNNRVILNICSGKKDFNDILVAAGKHGSTTRKKALDELRAALQIPSC